MINSLEICLFFVIFLTSVRSLQFCPIRFGCQKGPFLFQFPGKSAALLPFFAICREIDFVRFASDDKKGAFRVNYLSCVERSRGCLGAGRGEPDIAVVPITYRALSARGAAYGPGGGPDSAVVSITYRALIARGMC